MHKKGETTMFLRAFGAWPIAKLSANKKRVMIQGPVCDSSEVMGWHLKKMRNSTADTPPPIHVSSFAFNTSILWDPERWGRTFSTRDATQVQFLTYFCEKTKVLGLVLNMLNVCRILSSM